MNDFFFSLNFRILSLFIHGISCGLTHTVMNWGSGGLVGRGRRGGRLFQEVCSKTLSGYWSMSSI